VRHGVHVGHCGGVPAQRAPERRAFACGRRRVADGEPAGGNADGATFNAAVNTAVNTAVNAGRRNVTDVHRAAEAGNAGDRAGDW
jgi:hypothetical protein